MNVIVPQLGETVTEGKITAWFKAVGDTVAAGDNLFEIETDKVTTEVQATESGVLSEIRVAAGATVPVGTVVAVVGDTVAPASIPSAHASTPTPTLPRGRGRAREGAAAGNGASPPRELEPFNEVRTPTLGYGGVNGPMGLKVTPLARRLAQETGLDLAAVADAVRARGGRRIAAADVKAAPSPAARPAPALALRDGDRVEPLNRIRARTAEHLAHSWRTIPHVFQAVEIDFSAIERARQAAKAAFSERHGVSLTYLPFVARALCLAIAEFPRVNASFDRDRLILHRDVHLGIAVDLAHEGLIVPVVAHADEMTAAGLAKAIARQSAKARAGKLAPADVEGGTYTISNNGSFGTLTTAAIINAPQVAILSLDAVRKRATVVETEHGDAIAARPIGVVGQSFDHRAFDGAYAAAFLNRLKQIAETRDWASELA
jgi:2-oxoglutarate dehydrogenase E2 component (dihydrolipoamide succinyltransferase)